jgi:hypothetical protein
MIEGEYSMDSKITVQWHNPEQTILLIKMKFGWTWGDMYHAATEGEELVSSVTHSVCTIADFSEANQIPLHALTHLNNINRTARPNQTKLAIVGLSVVGKSMINIFIRLYGTFVQGADIKLVSTLEDAYKFFNVEAGNMQAH